MRDRIADDSTPVGERRPWWRRLLPAPDLPVEVLLFKTEHCPLCEEAEELLRTQARRLGLRLKIEDSRTRPDLQKRHALESPVVFIEGKKRFMGRVPLPLLRREVDAARRFKREG